jgi:hypothetical protein
MLAHQFGEWDARLAILENAYDLTLSESGLPHGRSF